MFRSGLLATLLLLPMASPSFAQDHAGHGDDHHEVSAGALTITHPWARAAAAGGQTVVYLELHNDGEAVEFVGAESDVAQSVELVGATLNAEGQQAFQPVGAATIPPGDFDLDPDGLGLLLSGLTQDLAQGEEFEVELEFGNGEHMHLHVEVEAADATQHSHAGHSH